MNDLADDDFRRAYQAFGRRHDDQRTVLLEILPNVTAKPQAVRRRTGRRIHFRGSLAAVILLLAASVAFFKMGPTQRVYGLDGLQQRLMALRSLHIKGWIYHQTKTEFGDATLRFPTETYHERPYRKYGIHYGFSDDGDKLVEVTTSTVVGDGSKTMMVDHDGKRAFVMPTDKINSELQVEWNLQQSLIKQILQGAPGEYQLVGTEKIGAVMCDMYENVDPIGKPIRIRKKLWLNPDDGMPVKLIGYVVNPDEDELFWEWSEIHVNVDPPAEMFAFAVPESYEKVESRVEGATPSIQPQGSAGSDKHWASVWTGLIIDDRAVLVCWSQRTTVDGGQAWFHTAPTFSLSGVEERPCDEISLRTDVGDEDQWRWSLVLPRDKRPVGRDSMNMVCKTVGPRGDTISMGTLPLTFETGRLVKLVEEVQRRTLPADASANDVWTMEELRAKLSE